MNVPRLFKRHLIRWRTLHKAVTICVLASLLAGLIPPPVVGTTLPTAFAEPIAALLPDTPVALAAGTISGTVFQDFNSDGSLSSGTVTDIGMAGVTVTVYDSDGAAQGTDQTDATGGYSIAATGTGPYRVEFTTLPTGYYPTTHNSNSGSNTTAPNSTATTAGTTVQFVPDGNSSNVNLGINRPEAYAQSDVRLAVPMQLAGDQSETSAVLYDWPYTNSGTTPTARTAAQASQIGTTWGLAYQRTTKTLFASAVVRRHAGLGSLGLGGIYQIDYASGSPVASTFVDLDAAPFSANFGTLGNNSTRGLPATPTTASQDTSAFAAVAKEGIGDIDLSEDGNTLWVVNLNGVTSNVAGTLLALDVTGGTAPTSATSYAISSFSGLPTCTNGVLRPWALKFANGKGYLGAVCSAELAGGVRDNLVGYVLSFDPDAPTAFTTELTIPMGSTYGKGIALQLTSAADLPSIAPNTEQWYPWTDTYTDVSFNRSPNGLIVARPTPVLSDIEFDESGHLIVGFLDRAAMQLGSVNYPPTSTAYTIQVIGSGDVVRACVDGAGTYTLESNGACGGLNGAGVGNGDGPGGGEYYHDFFTIFTLQHQEILNGGLAVLAGTREIAVTAFDPVASLDTAGILFLANSTGAKNDGYQVGPTNQKNSTNGYFAKSFGIGDIELLADPAPLEIGNRVWNDADSDGLQDPNEAPISGVTVELYKNGVKVGQATTDATGEYYFTSGTSASDANTSDNIIHDSGIGILPGTGANGGDSLYEIRIPNVSGGSKQAALGSNSLTTANAGSDSIDSDGSISGVNASYAIPYADLAGSGYNNHTYDFGFGPPTGTIQIVKNTVGDDGTFAFTSADTQLDAVSITTVGNTGNSGTAFTKNAGAYTISEDALPANWALTNLTCSGDSDSGSTITLASRQVVIDLDAGEAIVCTFTNTYTAPVADPGSFSISKAIATTDGSNPTVSGTFDVVVSCPGVSGYPATLSLNADGTPIAAGNLAAGTVCSFSEDTLTLPAAPSGYTWVNAQIEPASIAIQSNVTATVTATNWLAPVPTAPAQVLTVTKTISGTGNGPFAITITGPSGYITNTQIDGGDVLTFSVPAQGVYTITESTPAGWTTVYTATPGTVSSVNGVVALQNANTATLASTPISGKVFRDFNSDGLITANGVMTDTGISAVTVTAYDKNGNSVGNATSAANGTYTINPTSDGPYRVEFSNLPSGYEPTTHGTGNGTSTQFVTTIGGASNVNLGINHPDDYSQSNPPIQFLIMQGGDTTGANANARTLIGISATASGLSAAQTGGIVFSQTGAVWGLAYQKQSKYTFAASMLHRHIGAPNGLDAVYVMDSADALNPTFLGHFSLAGIVPTNGGAAIDLGTVCRTAACATAVGNTGITADYTLSSDPTQPSVDLDAFAKAGSTGFGDIELDPATNRLWLVNTYQQALISLDASGAFAALPADVQQYPLTTMTNMPTCTGGNLRPWALKFYRGRGYVGLVCDAATTRVTANLRGYVVSFDPANPTSVSLEVTIPLTYGRPTGGAGNSNDFSWHPWALTSANLLQANSSVLANISAYGQPLIGDIEFGDNGDLVIALMDRTTLQIAPLNRTPVSGSTSNFRLDYRSAGGLVKYCRVGTGYVVEGTAATCPSTAGLASDYIGPTPRTFYNYVAGDLSGLGPLGALARQPGVDRLIYSSYDPHDAQTAGIYNYFTQGLNWAVQSTGARAPQFYGIQAAAGARRTVANGDGWPDPSNAQYFGKANGMGDVELLMDPAPIEIGNRVWNDLDGDGLQDPGEPGFSGLQVSRAGPTGTVSVNTDGDCAYYFNNLETGSAYTLPMSVPTGYGLTTPNVAALSGASVSSNHAISDTRDSDAVLVGGVATIYYTTGGAGQNNHGLDFGFTQPASGQVDILNTAPPVVADPGGFSISKAIATTDGSSPSVSGSFDVVVTCPGVSGYPATLSLDADGTPITAGNLVSGTVCSFSEDTLTLPAAPSGYTWVNAQIDPASITIHSNVTATVTATNWLAPVPTAPTHVLTVTKTISGTGSGPFDITITGPSSYITTTQIDNGDVLTFNVPTQGIYTVTESTPAGWTTVYTATPGTSGGSQAVVTLQNANSATLATTPITGQVFRDFNSDGQITANGTITDTGVSGVMVTAYDKNGNAVGSATSAANGAYTINPTAAGPYRVMFSNLPVGYEPTSHGPSAGSGDNGTSTQFVTDVAGASNVNLGISYPVDYSQNNPKIAMAIFLQTDLSSRLPLSATLFTFPLANTAELDGNINGTTANAGGTGISYSPQRPLPTMAAAESQIGNVWGLAWDRFTRNLYAASYVKRSAKLGPEDSTGVIYRIANADTAPSPSLFVDLNAALGAGTTGANPHPIASTTWEPEDPNGDPNTRQLAGKIGLGDIDLSLDGKTLYAVNMFDRRLYYMPTDVTPTAANIQSLPIPTSGLVTASSTGLNQTCDAADVRPMALSVDRNGTVYVGAVCSAETTASYGSLTEATYAMHMYVWQVDFTTSNFTLIFSDTLRFNRDSSNTVYNNVDTGSAPQLCSDWVPWTNFVDSDPHDCRDNQPLLSDIVIDSNTMYLGLRDRAADQSNEGRFGGYGFSGDLYVACLSGAVYAMENNGVCGGVTNGNGATSNNQGPGGDEFFYQDQQADNVPNSGNGGLAKLPGGDLLSTATDPVLFLTNGSSANNYESSGVQKYRVDKGTQTGAYNLTWNQDRYRVGKGLGVGDVEILSDPAPIEIGNRVWDDTDGDGVQDPGEPGLNGLTVSLQGPTNTVTTQTSGDGSYYFSVNRVTAYTLTITPPTGYSVTTPNAGALSGTSVSSNHAISDTIDSDAALVGGLATIYYTTGGAGQNNHGLDFGFTQPASGQVDILNTAPVAALVSLGNRVWYDTNNNGAVDGGEQNVANGVTVELYQDSDSSGGFSTGDNRLASTVTSGGYYTFTNLTPSSSDATRYLVVITDTNFLAGGLLYGYHNSAGQVTDNSLAADNDKDHGAVSGTLGQNGDVVASTVISLTAGTQPTGEANEANDPIQSATDANSNQTIDFGFYSLSVGNRVWNDNGAGANADNGQLDSGENGLDGVTVELLDSSNAVVSTTTTSNGGYYTFTGLISGTYSVRISGYPASYRSSTDTVNAAAPTSADDDDNGPGTGTGTLTSSGFALVPGSSANGHSADNATGVTSNPRIDFGLYAAPASFALDKRLVSPVSGVAAVGDPVVYTLVVTNTGAITLTTITLVDSYDANWLQYNSASTAPTAQATGVLTWTLTSPTTPLPLSAGEVMTVTVTFTAVKP